MTSRFLVRCSTNWAMKSRTLGAGHDQLWFDMFPWKNWVLMIYEINHIWTAEMKWEWRKKKSGLEVPNFFSGFFTNCTNCVHCDDHFSADLAQLVEHRTGNRKVTGSNPVEVLNFLFSGFFTQLHKLLSLLRSFLHSLFISAVHIWFISYIVNNYFSVDIF